MKQRSIWLNGGDEVKPEQPIQNIIRIEGLDGSDDDSTISHVRGTENQIVFYGEINTVTAGEICRLFHDTDLRLQNTKNMLGTDYDPTIHFKIRSDGGSLFDSLAVLDRMTTLKTKVHTYVEGGAASGATLISVAGKRRFIGKNSFMLIHQLSAGAYGNFQQLEDQQANYKRLMTSIKDIYKEYTKMPMKKLDEILKHDLWLTAKECLEYGMVDEII